MFCLFQIMNGPLCNSLIIVTLLLVHVTLVKPEEHGTSSQAGPIREMRKLLLTKDNIEEHLARKGQPCCNVMVVTGCITFLKWA